MDGVRVADRALTASTHSSRPALAPMQLRTVQAEQEAGYKKQQQHKAARHKGSRKGVIPVPSLREEGNQKEHRLRVPMAQAH